VLHQIGIGALGPVFRTYEPTRDRLVAVKVFRLDIIPEQAQALANALSGTTQAALFHPSIVQPITAGVEGTLAYRAEEYVAAESLDVAMRHYAPASIDKTLPFITQLAGAIDFARAAGIGHGGLHPRDIFVTPDDARATGFGVVEALEHVGIRAPVRRPYTAPERIDGAGWGTAADVFSLAAIAFELLTGRRPSGTGVQIGALLDGPHRDALHAVLARAMDGDPAKRFPTALAFVSALEAASRDATAGAPATSTAPVVPAETPAVSATPIVAATTAAAAAPIVVESAPTASVAPKPTPSTAVPPSMPKPAAPSTPPAALAPPMAATPGEFELEQELEPAHVEPRTDVPPPSPFMKSPRLPAEDLASARHADETDATLRLDLAAAAPGLFDRTEDHTDVLRAGAATEETVRAMSRDVVGAHAADAEIRQPVETAHDSAPSFAREDGPNYGAASAAQLHEPRGDERMFGSEPDVADVVERSRPRILPYAITLVLGLLAGFAAAYFVLSGERAAQPAGDGASTAGAPPSAATSSAAPTGAATPDKPGQYSEQKVTQTPPPPSEAPPVPTEGVREPAHSTSAAAAAAPRPVATTGRLTVRSTPSHASVTINGKWRGRTPLTLDDLAFGKYSVRVVQPGFQTARDEFTLHATDAAHSFEPTLVPEERAAPAPRAAAPAPRAAAPAPSTPATFTGSVFVDSRPRGATVLLDGKSVGQTPLSVPGVPVGTHVVKIEMAGKKPWSSTTRVSAGTMSRVTGSLEDR